MLSDLAVHQGSAARRRRCFALLRSLATGILAALLLAQGSPAQAVSDQQIGWCNGGDNATPELSVGGCTAMIQSGEYSGEELAIVFNNRGIAYFKNGQFERAIQDYDQAIRLSPNFFNALSGRCWNRAIVGSDLAGAIADCNRALTLNPTITYTRGSRGFAYLKMSNYGAAIVDFDAALKAHPENAASLYGRGLAKRAKGDAAGASADMLAAERLDPTIAQKFVAWGVNPEAALQTTAFPGEPAGPATTARSEDHLHAAGPPDAAIPSAVSALPVHLSATPPAATDSATQPSATRGSGSPLPTEGATPVTRQTPVSSPLDPPSTAEGAPAAATPSTVSAALENARVKPPARAPAAPLASPGPSAIDAPIEQATTRPAPTEQTAALPLPAEAIAALVKRGNDLLSTGDVVAARSAYERAAASGSRTAATGVAKTYDPVFLAQSGVRGLRGNPQQAALWYSKAAAAGDHEAQQRLKRLRAQFPQ
jgi:tetratricopeptide (TPR) repeat protein